MARVLCLHGLGGTGRTMWPLVAALSSVRHTAFAPTLPGHGSVPDDLLTVRWSDWVAAALEWPCDVVVGQSLGGALALAVAAEGRCSGVVAVNAVPPDPDAVDGVEWRRSRGHEWLEDWPTFPGETAYSRLPLHAVEEMARGAMGIDLRAVTQPVLLVNSAHDAVVDPASADVIAAALGARPNRLVLPLGGHVATLDDDSATLTAAVTTFVDSLAASRR
jgi:carboxylesterase